MTRTRATVVTVRLDQHRAFLDSFGTGPTAGADPNVRVTRTIVLERDDRVDVTWRPVPGAIVATIAQIDVDAPDSHLIPVRIVLIEEDGRRFARDVVTAAGMDPALPRDAFTERGLADGWQDPTRGDQMQAAFEQFARWPASFPLLLVRADDLASPWLTKVRDAIPLPFRRAMGTFAITSAVADAVDATLAEHRITALEPDTAVLLIGRDGTLTERHRLRRQGRIRALGSAIDALLGEIAEEALATAGLDDEDEALIRTLQAKVADSDAAITRLRAELGRTQAANRRAQAEVRRLEHEVERLRSTSDPASPPPTRSAGSPDPRTAEEPSVHEQAASVVDGPDAPAADADRWSQLPTCDAETFAAMLAQARSDLPMVVIDDAVEKLVLPLEDQPKSAIWRRRAWLSLALLDAYARARRDDAGNATFRGWIERTPHPQIRPDHIRSGETQTMRSNRRFREARTFGVPTEVDQSGRALFLTHIYIETGRTDPSPRLHFLDDTGRSRTGLVYVGHLGPHLRTRRTN